MGVLPLQFQEGTTRKTLKLDGSERISIDVDDQLKPGQLLNMTIMHHDGREQIIPVLCRIDTANEIEYFRHGGILQYVLRHLK